MAHIIIAGRPNSEDTSECIILADNLQAKFPTVRFVKVLKHADEWDEYAEKLCNLYGFLKNTHPLIFYSNGSFIGVKEDFFKLIKSNFKIPLLNEDCKLTVHYSAVKALTQENIKITNEEYFTRIKGSKLRDKIEKKLEEITRNDIDSIETMTRYNGLDSVYEEDYLGDFKIFFKYSNKFQPREGEYQPHTDSLQTAVIEVDTPKPAQTLMSVNLNIENSPIKKVLSKEGEQEFEENLVAQEEGVVTDGENLDTIPNEEAGEENIVAKKKPPKSKINIF